MLKGQTRHYCRGLQFPHLSPSTIFHSTFNTQGENTHSLLSTKTKMGVKPVSSCSVLCRSVTVSIWQTEEADLCGLPSRLLKGSVICHKKKKTEETKTKQDAIACSSTATFRNRDCFTVTQRGANIRFPAAIKK